MQAYKLHLTVFSREVSCAMASDVLMASGHKLIIPEACRAYAGVFSEVDSKLKPSHSPQGLAIDLLDSKKLPRSRTNILFENKLDTLCSYLGVQLKTGWFRPSKSPAGAQVFNVPKKNGTLRLCVEFMRSEPDHEEKSLPATPDQ
jgi:hypothetical protein